MQRIDNIETPWQSFIETTGFNVKNNNSTPQWVIPADISPKQFKQIDTLVRQYIRDRNEHFNKIARGFFSQTDISINTLAFAKSIGLTAGLLRSPKDNSRNNGKIRAVNAYRSSLLLGDSISASIFDCTPDTICTQNEKLFLHLLSSLSEEQIFDAEKTLSSRKNSILKDYIDEVQTLKGESEFPQKQLVIDEFRYYCDDAKATRPPRKVPAFMFDDEYIIYIRRLNQLRIKNLSFQSHTPLVGSTLAERRYMADIRNGNADTLGSIATFIMLSFRTLVGVDDMFSYIPWFADGRYVYCDFQHNEFFALNRHERQWVSLFQGFHPEQQSEIIAHCIDKYNVKRLNPVVEIPRFQSDAPLQL